MFTMDIKGKNDVVTALVIECLTRYAKGFFCADFEQTDDGHAWLDASLLYENKSAGGKLHMFCVDSYRIDSPDFCRLALLVPSAGGALCRAGGVGVTFVTEWVLSRYIRRYADCLGDEYAAENRAAQFQNMRERVEAILKKNAAIRCCKVDHFYTGYVVSNANFDLLPRQGEPDAAYQKRFRRAVQDNDLFLLAAPEAGGASKVYQFTQEECSMNVYMLAQCFDAQKHKISRQAMPLWARQTASPLKLSEIVPFQAQGWQMLSSALNLQEGKLYFTPAAKIYEGQFLPVAAGRYKILWHTCNEKVDAMLLLLENQPTACFGPTECLAQSEIQPADASVWERLAGLCFFATNRKLQKDSCIGLSGCKLPIQGDLIGLKEGIRLVMRDDGLNKAVFERPARKNFSIAIARRSGAAVAVCLYSSPTF